MVLHLEPQSTMVIPVGLLDELVVMNLPPCWMGDPGGGGALKRYGKVFQLN